MPGGRTRRYSARIALEKRTVIRPDCRRATRRETVPLKS